MWQSWRWIVTKTRESKPFFIGFATVCGVVPGVIGFCVMQLTNSRAPDLEAKLRHNARPDSLVSTVLGELQRKEDTNDRYVAALRGETLTRNPYARIQNVPNPNPATKEQQQQQQQE